LGSGVSTQAGIPDYKELVRFLAKYAEIKDIEEDSPIIFELAKMKLGSKKVNSIISKINNRYSPTELHFKLADSPAQYFITWNFDNLLEKAMQKENVSFHSQFLGEGVIKEYNTEKNIKTILKFRESTARYPFFISNSKLDDESRINRWMYNEKLLRKILGHSLVIFLGFNAKKELNYFYEDFWTERFTPNNWFVVTREIDSLQRDLWQQRGINIVSIKDEDLTTFVAELSQRIKTHKIQKIRKDIRKGNQIFLSSPRNSYLNEFVRQTLKNAGFVASSIDEIPSSGRTIMEKFYTVVNDSKGAIVIIDDQDRMNNKIESYKTSRNNILFELGYLIGSLGSENVLVLNGSERRIPSDIESIIYLNTIRFNQQEISSTILNWLNSLD
jgi:predicted nucleotide-binding protein